MIVYNEWLIRNFTKGWCDEAFDLDELRVKARIRMRERKRKKVINPFGEYSVHVAVLYQTADDDAGEMQLSYDFLKEVLGTFVDDLELFDEDDHWEAFNLVCETIEQYLKEKTGLQGHFEIDLYVAGGCVDLYYSEKAPEWSEIYV